MDKYKLAPTFILILTFSFIPLSQSAEDLRAILRKTSCVFIEDWSFYDLRPLEKTNSSYKIRQQTRLEEDGLTLFDDIYYFNLCRASPIPSS